MKKFKIRASSTHEIMGGSERITQAQLQNLDVFLKKGKLTEKQEQYKSDLIKKRDNPTELLQMGKTHCETWLKEQLYGRKKEISSKFIEKGLIVEDNSIDFISEYLGIGLLLKNESLFEDEYKCGTPDIVLKDTIIEVKNSWDCFTFPLFSDKIPNKEYYWQAQSYLSLTDRNICKLIYVITDTPDHLIKKEALYYCRNNGYDDFDEDILKKFKEKMTYSNIKNDLKIKIFVIERNDDDIKKINEQVIKCRNYINKLKIQIKL